MRIKKSILNIGVIFISTFLCLVLLEIILRSKNALKKIPESKKSHSIPMQIPLDSPYLYGLNPEHPDISSQGLRDNEVIIPKPEGTLRILVLGDSVIFGKDVSRDKTFPNSLEALLQEQFAPVDVINTGVEAYTAYNELQYFMTKGKEFEPDLVIIAFCLNDVVNPRLHWGGEHGKINGIPREAIPNLEYDQNVVLPGILEKQKAKNLKNAKQEIPLLRHSVLFKSLQWRFNHLFQKEGEEQVIDTSGVPTYLTFEDTISIHVLCDESTPEWQWLTSIYTELNEAVKKINATLIIVLFPLAYQLEEGYPFVPQRNLMQFCTENEIPCVDLLPTLRQHSKEEIFLLNNSGKYDIWHLSEYGHALSAQIVMQSLLGNKGLLKDEVGVDQG